MDRTACDIFNELSTQGVADITIKKGSPLAIKIKNEVTELAATATFNKDIICNLSNEFQFFGIIVNFIN